VLRAWRGKAVVLIGVALLVLPAGSASASTEAIPPKQWAANFCGSVGAWISVIQKRTSAYNKAIATWRASSNKKISTIRGVVVAYVRDTAASTDQMVSNVKRAGPPAVTNGAKTQTQVNAALAQVSAVFHRALAQARALPTSNPILFISKTTALGQQITSGLSKIGVAFTAIGRTSSPALDTAARTTAACNKLG
jgi:hypothetical protein